MKIKNFLVMLTAVLSFHVSADVLRWSGSTWSNATWGYSASDYDGDSVVNNADNCHLISNAGQLNTDADAYGNVCDSDDDNDGLSDSVELEWGLDPVISDYDADSINDL